MFWPKYQLGSPAALTQCDLRSSGYRLSADYAHR
jgi:hypothetical protein